MLICLLIEIVILLRIQRIIVALFLSCFCALPALRAERSDSAVVRFLENEYGVRFTSDNRMVFFQNGQEKFDDLFSAVRQAKSTIHLEYFNFRNDSISALLFQLLAERVKAGVKVRALFDGFGNSSNNRPLRKTHLQALRQQGIEIYEYDPIRFPYINHVFKRDHRKIVVIDGLIGYTGGMNVADYYIKGKPEFGNWRDIHVRVEGSVVGDLQRSFVGFWNEVTGQTLQGDTLYPGFRDARKSFEGLKADTTATAGRKLIGFVNRIPGRTPRIVRETFLTAFESARQQIQIINPYFTLNRKLRRALRRAIERGVDVQVMVSDKSDIPITPRIVEYNVHQLMKLGAKIYFYTGGFHHSKVLMVDSSFCYIGSANLNARSLAFDYECNLLVPDVSSTQALQSIFEADKRTNCYQLTPERWKRFKRSRRFSAWLFHFLAPFV